MRNAEDDFASLPIIEWEDACYRLIPSRFPPVTVYEGLVPYENLEALTTLEGLTNPRLRSEARILRNNSSGNISPNQLQNWNLAPFAYGNPEGSTFFGEEFPCLEVAADRQTALAVAVARRERFMSRTDEAPIGLDMRLLKTPVAGRFWDVRSLGAIEGGSFGRSVGRNLPQGTSGIIFKASERPSGTAVAIIDGSCLGQSLQSAHYRFVWNGREIKSLYAFADNGVVIDAKRLAGENDVLAA